MWFALSAAEMKYKTVDGETERLYFSFANLFLESVQKHQMICFPPKVMPKWNNNIESCWLQPGVTQKERK